MTGAHGLNFTNVNSSYVLNNNITVRSDQSIGVYFRQSVNDTIANNLINTTGTGGSKYGVQVTSSANNNTIINNTIRTDGSGSNNYGIYLFNIVSGNLVQGNSITTNGTLSNYGMRLTSSVIPAARS